MPIASGAQPASSHIPGPTVSRLPVYRRALAVMHNERRMAISSGELAVIAGVNASTLRRDLWRLGSVGTPGTGYEVAHLLARVDRALALDREWLVAIVGIGNLGRALTGFWGVATTQFRIAALLDVHPAVVGTSLAHLEVIHLDELAVVMESVPIAIGVIATPAAVAQAVADRLIEAGVSSILNFAPTVLNTPERVDVRQVDLVAELQVLAFYGSQRDRSSSSVTPASDRAGPVELHR